MDGMVCDDDNNNDGGHMCDVRYVNCCGFFLPCVLADRDVPSLENLSGGGEKSLVEAYLLKATINKDSHEVRKKVG